MRLMIVKILYVLIEYLFFYFGNYWVKDVKFYASHASHASHASYASYAVVGRLLTMHMMAVSCRWVKFKFKTCSPIWTTTLVVVSTCVSTVGKSNDGTDEVEVWNPGTDD